MCGFKLSVFEKMKLGKKFLLDPESLFRESGTRFLIIYLIHIEERGTNCFLRGGGLFKNS